MEEIKVGDYIRTKEGYIGKILRLGDEFSYDCIYESGDFKYAVGFHSIVKHSPNIIDVIEEGDLVNGYLIVGIGIDPFNKKKILRTSVDRCDCWWDRPLVQFHNEDIEIVVTSEQLKNCKYEVNK